MWLIGAMGGAKWFWERKAGVRSGGGGRRVEGMRVEYMREKEIMRCVTEGSRWKKVC